MAVVITFWRPPWWRVKRHPSVCVMKLVIIIEILVSPLLLCSKSGCKSFVFLFLLDAFTPVLCSVHLWWLNSRCIYAQVFNRAKKYSASLQRLKLEEKKEKKRKTRKQTSKWTNCDGKFKTPQLPLTTAYISIILQLIKWHWQQSPPK